MIFIDIYIYLYLYYRLSTNLYIYDLFYSAIHEHNDIYSKLNMTGGSPVYLLDTKACTQQFIFES